MSIERARELVIRSGKAADQYLMISVSDSGVGLPSDQANQIFDAFFTTKSHGLGMDFGLAVPSLNRTAAPYGQPTTRRMAQAFPSPFPFQSMHRNHQPSHRTVIPTYNCAAFTVGA
jgi:hypothetical protein